MLTRDQLKGVLGAVTQFLNCGEVEPLDQWLKDNCVAYRRRHERYAALDAANPAHFAEIDRLEDWPLAERAKVVDLFALTGTKGR